MAQDRLPELFHVIVQTYHNNFFLPTNVPCRNLVEGHPRNISTKSFGNWPDTFREEDFYSFQYNHTRQNTLPQVTTFSHRSIWLEKIS